MRTILEFLWFLTSRIMWAGSVIGPLLLFGGPASCGGLWVSFRPVLTAYDRVLFVGIFFLFSLVCLSYTLFLRRQVESHPRLKYAYIVLALGLPCGVASPAIACLTSAALIGLCWWHEARRISPGHCRVCRYNLTGNVSGRCPECGTPLSEALQPETRPSTDLGEALLRHKQVSARVLAGLFVVGALAAVYEYTGWPCHVQTAWLLLLEPVLPMHGNVELWSRFTAATMTPAEARRFLAGNIRVVVSAPTPQSAAAGIDVVISSEGQVPQDVGRAYIAEYALLVDGKPVQPSRIYAGGGQGIDLADPWYRIASTEHFQIDGLVPGVRHIRVLANVGFGGFFGSRAAGAVSRSPYGWLIDETVVVDVNE